VPFFKPRPSLFVIHTAHDIAFTLDYNQHRRYLSMQKLRTLAHEVEAVYQELAKTFIDYQQRRELFCRSGCGKCCLHPNIHASVLEMLPLALHFYDAGKAEDVLNLLDSAPDEQCVFYQATSDDKLQGYCGIYQHRGSICRMFGAAGYPDKYGEAELSTCQPIKEDNANALQLTLLEIKQDPPPMMAHWKNRVINIDYELGHEDLPLNDAVRSAILKVLFKAQFDQADE
jgi:Fe-S-cluster containining protein